MQIAHSAGTPHCKTCMCIVQCTLHCTLSHVCLGGVASVWDFHMLHSSHISHFAQCDKTSHTFVQFAQSVTGVLLVDATNSSVRHRQTSLSAPLCDSLHSVTNNTLQFAQCDRCVVEMQTAVWCGVKQAFPRLCQAPPHYSAPKVATSALTNKIQQICPKIQTLSNSTELPHKKLAQST